MRLAADAFQPVQVGVPWPRFTEEGTMHVRGISSHYLVGFALIIVFFGACGGDEPGPVEPERSDVEGLPDAAVDGSSDTEDLAFRITIQVPDADTFVVQGKSETVPVTIERLNGYDGPVVLRPEGLPEGLTAASISIPPGAHDGELVVHAAAERSQGKASFSVTAGRDASDPARGEASVQVFVRGPSGTLDTTFGDGGMVTGTIGDFSHGVVSPDGKIVAVGQGSEGIQAARFHADGTLDSSFGAQGIASVSLGVINGAYPRVAVDATGRVLVSGTNIEPSRWTASVARLSVSGQLDPTWGSSGVATFADPSGRSTEGYDLAPGPSGTTFLVTTRSYTLIRLLRLTPSGALDTSYGAPNGYSTVRINGGASPDPPPYFYLGDRIAVADDGFALLAYSVVSESSKYGPMVSAVLPHGGTRASTISTPDMDERRDVRIARRKDGRAVIAFRGANGHTQLWQFETDLSRDTGFGTSGVAEGFSGGAHSIHELPDGKLLIVGATGPLSHLALQRFHANGTPDETFGPAGLVRVPGTSEGYGLSAFTQTDGRIIVVGGRSNPFVSLILRLWI